MIDALVAYPGHVIATLRSKTEYIVEENKPAIFVVNKWDLVKESMPTEKMGDYIRAMFPMLEHVPIAFITAIADAPCDASVTGVP